MMPAWMSRAVCAEDNGKPYNALTEHARVHICRTACPVMAECRAYILAVTTAQRADECEPGGGMTARQLAREVRNRAGVESEPQEDLLSFIDHEIRAALVGAA